MAQDSCPCELTEESKEIANIFSEIPIKVHGIEFSSSTALKE